MTKASDKAAGGLLGGVQAGNVQAQADAARRDRRATTMALAKIQPRKDDTREANAQHVATLAESIEALGLIEPIAVDRVGRLVAGLHRLEALRMLEVEGRRPDLVKAVPVHVLDFDAEEDPALALGIEVAENEHRRDYTADEVRELAQRLKAAGFRDSAGRPRKGEKALRPALAAIVGRSGRHVRRILSGEPEPEPTGPKPFGDVERASKALQTAVGGVLARWPRGERQAAADELVRLADLVRKGRAVRR